MDLPVFYTPELSSDTYELSREEARHAVKVLRLQPGKQVYLADGVGHWHVAEVLVAAGHHCKVSIVETLTPAPAKDWRLHIACAPTKNTSRFEWFLEKATEIGIDRITPLICARSERRMVKHDRLERVLIAAMKQSRQSHLPKLDEAVPFSEFVNLASTGQRFVAHCADEEQRFPLKTQYRPGSEVLVLIGPEGDFTSDEISTALAQHFQPITLGNSRLRTETAAIAACHTINLLNA